MIKKIKEAYEFLTLGLNWAANDWAIPDAVEYAVQIGDGSILKDGALTSRTEQLDRLKRYRECWPEAQLVQRNVYHGEWRETE